MTDAVDLDLLKEIVNSNDMVSFSDDNIAIVLSEPVTEDWEEDLASLKVDELTDGEWSIGEPDDGDYGSIVLESLPGCDVVKDDFELGKHRFRKKF